MKSLITWVEATGFAPVWFLVIFLAASFLMIWRLESMNKSGVEGTVLGTLVMPYCSGIGNLIFAFILGAEGGPGSEVLTNSLVNNVTNMTLLLGLPAMIWGMRVMSGGNSGGGSGSSKGGKKKSRKGKGDQQEQRVNRLSLLLTLTAVLFFTGATWAMAAKGTITAGDGVVLIGLFLFWQCFHVFDVLKNNVRQNKTFTWRTAMDLALLGVGAYAIYFSTDWLVNWISSSHTGFFSAKYLGWLSGWLMVVPNATLAFYYAYKGKPEVVYTSQVGDGHVSIPLCIGVYALYRPIKVPGFFHTGVVILLVAACVHFFFVALFGRLPRLIGWVLVAAYVLFLAAGLGA